MIILHFDLQPQFKYMNYFIYTSRHFTPHGRYELNNWTGLAPDVWLHSSVGRASHRYRGGHEFESRWSLDFFQASSFQLLKLENLLQWSFFTLSYSRFVYTDTWRYSKPWCRPQFQFQNALFYHNNSHLLVSYEDALCVQLVLNAKLVDH